MLYRLRALVSIFFVNSVLASPLFADAEEGLFVAAKIIYESAQEQPDEMRVESYQRVRSLLDKIVSEYPASDLAVRILLQDTIDGLNVAHLDEFIDSAAIAEPRDDVRLEHEVDEATDAPDEAVSAAVPPTVKEDLVLPQAETTSPTAHHLVSDANSESELSFSKNDIRDLQARLLVIGFDPNGVDGVIGRGTRSAIRSWQASIGAAQTGYMSAELYDFLKTASEGRLQIWLENAANAKAYKPPPPIALGPRNMSGTWRYTSRCGANSRMPNTRITGTMTMRHAGGNQYSGTLTNSQGLRARLGAVLNGRTVRGTANFGLLFGRVNLNARVDNQQLVLRGRDSNGCSFYASK